MVGAALSSMAISTIKYDGNGTLISICKYCIIVLGNLARNWSKQDCYSLVLSQLELRTLLTIPFHKQCILTQEMSVKPSAIAISQKAKSVVKSPHDCPLTPKNSYLKFLKTLYGLRRNSNWIHPMSQCSMHLHQSFNQSETTNLYQSLHFRYTWTQPTL